MKLRDVCEMLSATVLCGDVDKSFEGVYVGDLLSRAMSRVECDNLWVTIMSNVNVVAVATLTEQETRDVLDGVTAELPEETDA